MGCLRGGRLWRRTRGELQGFATFLGGPPQLTNTWRLCHPGRARAALPAASNAAPFPTAPLLLNPGGTGRGAPAGAACHPCAVHAAPHQKTDRRPGKFLGRTATVPSRVRHKWQAACGAVEGWPCETQPSFVLRLRNAPPLQMQQLPKKLDYVIVGWAGRGAQHELRGQSNFGRQRSTGGRCRRPWRHALASVNLVARTRRKSWD